MNILLTNIILTIGQNKGNFCDGKGRLHYRLCFKNLTKNVFLFHQFKTKDKSL